VATLHVRNVPDELYEELRARAEANDRSIGAEAVQLLEAQLLRHEPPRSSPFRRRRRSTHRPGPFSHFSQRARAAVVAAQEAARELTHDHVGTGHLLLALVRVEEGLAATALQQLGIDEQRVRTELEAGIPPSEELRGQIPFEPGAKKALELALRESLAQGQDSIGTEHLLLGIVREGASLGAEIVRSVEPDAERVRAVVLQLIPGLGDASPGVVPPGAPVLRRPRSAFRVLDLEGDAADWERQLNEAAAEGFDLVELVERRAVLRR
jgi:hypothetical protein